MRLIDTQGRIGILDDKPVLVRVAMEHRDDRVQVVSRKLGLRLFRTHLIVLEREQMSQGVEDTGNVCR